MSYNLNNIPQAEDLEIAVLGASMIEREAFSKIVNTIVSDDFYTPKHRIMFDAISELYKASEPIDMLTVMQKLKSLGNLDKIGGASYIAEITDLVSSSLHIERHAQIIKEKSIARQNISIYQDAISRIENGEDVADVMFLTDREIQKQQETLTGTQDARHISNVLGEALESTYNRVSLASNGVQSGINTGLNELNKLTNGWQNSELIVLAARPAMGKTAFLLHFAKIAAKDNVPVCLYSLEMSDISLANRMILSECNIDDYRFKSGNLSQSELNEIEEAVGRIYNLPIYIDDNASVSMSYIRAKSRVLKKQGKCEFVIIDYLQLASDNKNKNSNREQEIAKMSREAKIIAKELDIPVILLSQLNRSVEARADKKPLLSDLRESGAIEQDADIVCFIHRPEYYGVEVQDKQGNIVRNFGELIIAKNRNGATGSVKFTHNGTLNKIFDYEEEHKVPF